MKIVGISGSLRSGSFNSGLLRAAQASAPGHMAVEIASIAEVPLFNADVQSQGFPAAVEELVQRIREADGLLIATPEYNYSISGVLKNAIDWVSRAADQPFDGKAVAIMGASMGRLGTARAQYHLRQVFVYLNAMVMNRPEVFVGEAQAKFDEAGNLTDEGTRAFLSAYLEDLRTWVEQVKRRAQ